MSAWLKSGLIFAVISFFCAIVFTIAFPGCLLVTSLFIGLLCGIMTALWLKSPDAGLASKEGAKAGLLSGITTLLTNVVVGLIYYYVYGKKNSEDIMRELGWDTPSDGGAAEQFGQFVGASGSLVCCGVINLIIFIAFAALGAFIVTKFFIKE